MATIPITKRGAEKLRAELHQLKTVDRPWVINAISEARAQGDLSENAEYEVAKDRQGFIEGRIQEVEGKLSAAQIIDPSELDAGGKVVFGSTVELEEEESGEAVKYQIVGEDEADLKLGLINILQPDRARADRQGRGRHRRSAGTGRPEALRDRGRSLL
jgi:transcription elongation factor GreA